MKMYKLFILGIGLYGASHYNAGCGGERPIPSVNYQNDDAGTTRCNNNKVHDITSKLDMGNSDLDTKSK